MTEEKGNQEPVDAGTVNYDDLPPVGEASGSGELLYPDIPVVAFEALLGKGFSILEAQTMPSTQFEGTTLAVMRIKVNDKIPSLPADEGGEPGVVAKGGECSTRTGGVRVVDQIKATQVFPCRCRLAQETTGTGRKIYVLLGD